MIVHLSSVENVRYQGAMPIDDRNEEELWQLVLKGDRQAFALLYDAYAPRILGLATKMLCDHGAAEDIVQETFLILWRKAHLYLPEKGALLSWLYRVCRNLCLDRLKHAQNKWELKMPRDSIFHELMNSPSAVAVGTDAAMVEQMVAVALQNLAEAERELIELSFFRGLSHAEIARTLHLPLGTVKTRIASALRKLRHALGSIWHAGEDF